MLKSYIRLARRSLLKNKGFTLINILGLALGLATSLLIIFYVADELSYDKFNTNADRIYRVNADIKFGGNTSSYAITPPPLAAALISNFPEVEKVVRLYHDFGLRIKKGDVSIQEEKVVYADANMFSFFQFPLVAGNPNNALKDPNTVVITESTAKRYFNNIPAIGQTLLVNNQLNLKVTGVMRDLPKQSHFNFDFFISFATRPESKITSWFSYNCNTYLQLKRHADYKKLQAKFPAMIRKVNEGQSADMDMDAFEKMGNYFRMDLTPLTDIHLRSNRQYELAANSSMEYVYIFSAIAAFILLIACINFVNLATARSANRVREVGVRKVLGSSRQSLMAQFLSESVMVTLIATILAVITAWLMLPWFNQLSGKGLTVTWHSVTWLLPLLLAIVTVVGLLAGVYPAFFLSAFQPAQVLKGKVASGFKSSGLRSTLVILQFSISIILIVGTLVIYNQLRYIQDKNIGFNRNQVLIITNTNVLNSQAKLLKKELKQLPGVANTTLTSFLPVGVNRNPDAVFNNRAVDPKSALYTEIWSVDQDYLNTMGMSLVKGRNFSENMPTDTSGMIINESAARMLGYNLDPLNKKLYRPMSGKTQEYKILGVVKDFNFNSLRSNITPVVMVLNEDRGALSVRINSKNILIVVSQIERIWKSILPDQHFEYSFMNEDFDALYRSEKRMGQLFVAFTTLAIIIACLGLFGLAAYAAEQRNKEIGIRKVLGASITNIVALLSKDFVKLVTIAIVIAIPLAWFMMQKWLQGFAYRQNISWWVPVIAGFGALLIAFISISLQSVKAALSNPVNSLRSE